MKTKEEIFREYLAKNGLKFTQERQGILEEVFSIHKHFDAETLHESLKKKRKHFSRATVYRTLPLLVECGLIKEATVSQGRTSYEHVFGHKHHDHLLCIKCGQIIEFNEKELEKLKENICKRHEFKPKGHMLGIEGYCRGCFK